MTVPQADSTLVAIRKKIRRLTATSSESALPTADIDQYINTFYNNDFPYAIKLDQMRSVYTFYTVPNVDRYPLDVNYNMGLRDPMYVEGIQGFFYKDRDQFYRLFPRWPTQFQQSPANLSGTITGASQASSCVLTSVNTLSTGDVITIENVVGMTQLNGNTYSVLSATGTTITINVDSTGFTPYISGGTWSGTSRTFNFTLPGPFLSKEVVLGGTDFVGNPVRIGDDGNGNLQLQTPNPQVSVPIQTSSVPGMKNLNTANPGQDVVTNLGIVNYVTGVFSFTLQNPLLAGTVLNIWISQYQPSRPYCLLFWNNEFTIRPVPDFTYKVEVETYLTPVQFMNTTDVPILNQWWQYIAIGSAIKILEDRQDMEGVENLKQLFLRQEGLVLERQGVEEIGQRNVTIFAGNQQNLGWNQGWNQGWW